MADLFGPDAMIAQKAAARRAVMRRIVGFNGTDMRLSHPLGHGQLRDLCSLAGLPAPLFSEPVNIWVGRVRDALRDEGTPR